MEKVIRPPQFAPRRKPPAVANAVLGMVIFIVTEAMLFAGLISAHTIVKTSSIGMWPPPGQPRLPLEETAFNTAALLFSGALLYFASAAFERDRSRTQGPLLASIGLGAFFVAFQGVEWLSLIREGLTMTVSTYASFFYLIVGAHALHAVAGLLALGRAWLLLRHDRLDPGAFQAIQIFWYFVVGLWPILYLLVYL